MSTVDDLVTFLRAQLDEDERVARASEAISPAPWHVDDSRVWDAGDPRDLVASSTGINGRGAEMTPEDAAHIARYDPERALAEVEAKRRILDEHRGLECNNDSHPGGMHCAVCEYDDIQRGWYPCVTVRLLAQPYAGRSGFQPEWRLT